MVNSRAKGARVEREARDVWKEYGFTAQRTAQRTGNFGDNDVIVEEIDDDFFIEVKGVNRSSELHNWVKKATEQAKGKLAVIQHKKNGTAFIYTLGEQDFFELLFAALKGFELQTKKLRKGMKPLKVKDLISDHPPGHLEPITAEQQKMPAID